MNYYNEIKNKIIDNEVYSRVKDYSKERHTLIMHYEVGKLLLEAGSAYGEDIIGNYSNKLKVASILWKEVRESKNEKVYSKQLLNKYRYKIEEYHK